MTRRRLIEICLLALLVWGRVEADQAEPLRIVSPDFVVGRMIPPQFTCEGENSNPTLLISGVPSKAQSLVLLVQDEDATSSHFMHWVLFNIPTTTTRILPGQMAGMAGTNTFNKQGWQGPCPSPGSPHHYYFRLYALDTMLTLMDGASSKDVEQAMQGHVLTSAEYMGIYQRSGSGSEWWLPEVPPANLPQNQPQAKSAPQGPQPSPYGPPQNLGTPSGFGPPQTQ